MKGKGKEKERKGKKRENVGINSVMLQMSSQKSERLIFNHVWLKNERLEKEID